MFITFTPLLFVSRRRRLLVKRIKPTAFPLYKKRADPGRTGHGLAAARRVLFGVIGQKGGICIEFGQFKFIDPIALNHTNGTADKSSYTRLGRAAAWTHFDMIVRQETLKEFAVPFLPSLPGLFFEIYQSLFECTANRRPLLPESQAGKSDN